MKVMVTGGTGFVGSHSVAALVRAGHEPRLLVRRPERIAPALAAYGVAAADHVAGDVTGRESVERALAGCDAVLHCASVYSLGRHDARRIRETNVRGTEVVLGTARHTGSASTRSCTRRASSRSCQETDGRSRRSHRSDVRRRRTCAPRPSLRPPPGGSRSAEHPSSSSSPAAYTGPTTPTRARATRSSARSSAGS